MIKEAPHQQQPRPQLQQKQLQRREQQPRSGRGYRHTAWRAVYGKRGERESDPSARRRNHRQSRLAKCAHASGQPHPLAAVQLQGAGPLQEGQSTSVEFQLQS